jgi:hypothetical protein
METTTKIAFVIGGSRGLVKKPIYTIAQQDIDVIVTYRSKKEQTEVTAAEIKNTRPPCTMYRGVKRFLR